MDLMSHRYSAIESEAQSPIHAPLFHSSLHASHTSFPIIAVAVIGIVATAVLLVSYYIFVIKCCLNWHRIDLLGRFSFSRNRPGEDPLMGSSSAVESQGLDEAAIRSLPIFVFGGKDGGRSGECAICLSQFRHEEKLRAIPNCSHVFHIDCIDVWLQNNANCPLCRTSISSNVAEMNFNPDQILSPIPSSQDPIPQLRDSFTGRDEDYVMIEIRSGQGQGHAATNQSSSKIQTRFNSDELQSISPSPKKAKMSTARRKGTNLGSMGDEWIDNRRKDDQFMVQPVRRSFSMDSASDTQLYLAVQEIINKHTQVNNNEFGSNEGCSSSSKVKKSFFSFGQVKVPKSAVQPVTLEP